jgi:hypothetical protein
MPGSLSRWLGDALLVAMNPRRQKISTLVRVSGVLGIMPNIAALGKEVD